MPSPLNIGTREIPLQFAKEYSAIVNSNFKNFQFSGCTDITNELLNYWFSDAFCDTRKFNFHIGQANAIINTIYAHEVLKINSILDLYTECGTDLLQDSAFLTEISKPKYEYPKYCMKMATGTGKTWVMHALVLWQYLNANFESSKTGRYSKNFLLVAPGLIVYERLLDAYLGKLNEDGIRNFQSSDLKSFEDLFIPPHLRDLVFGFVQSSVSSKDEIGKKITGDGMIGITNWHLLINDEEEIESTSALENVPKNIKELLPVTPGKNSGNSLESLDNNYLRGGELEYLRNLDDLIVINDEAHHIHENKSYGEIKEVEWQKSLNFISETKGTKFIQIDFSATPYDVTGSSQKRTKHFFPHIVVDFDLKEAIREGLVKTIALDRRKEIATIDLEFKAVRDDDNKVLGLSEGQRIMLRAGLSRLKQLEDEFVGLMKDKNGVSDKYPKMFVICEDTFVTPHVVSFLNSEGLSDDDIMQIDSNKKGEIPTDEWQNVKQKLFTVDKHPDPKVIVSVLMLREGFDVSNICVIVPLRTADAPILLEQTIGRGLRLMWREPEFQDIKSENRKKLLVDKTEPDNYMDILHIIEHPNFVIFYDDLIKDGLVGITATSPKKGVIGDIINVGLKQDYKKYDMYWITIIKDKEEELEELSIDINKMSSLKSYSLEQLKKLVPKGGDKFYAEEMTVKTRFGEYIVKGDIFTAQSYNEFLAKMITNIESAVVSTGKRKKKSYPFMQINRAKLAETLDNYIRTKLFNEPFNPFENDNWRALLVAKGLIIDHLTKEISEAIYTAQQNVKVTEAVAIKNYFSEVPELRMREKYCVHAQKTIYEKQAFPSNKGGLERAFMDFIDGNSDTLRFIKINEYYHTFAKILYIREDGLLANYSPDFLVETQEGIYIVETKAQSNLSSGNVKQKQKATIDYVNRINQLPSEERSNKEWEYVLLGENTFYGLRDNGATPSEIFEYSKLTNAEVLGQLF